ncbi:MAG: hypothetical protein ACLTID_03985 [Barnesiella sp.]
MHRHYIIHNHFFFSGFQAEGMKSADIPITTIAEPHAINTSGIPTESPIIPIINKPITEGKKAYAAE